MDSKAERGQQDKYVVKTQQKHSNLSLSRIFINRKLNQISSSIDFFSTVTAWNIFKHKYCTKNSQLCAATLAKYFKQKPHFLLTYTDFIYITMYFWATSGQTMRAPLFRPVCLCARARLCVL